VIAIKGCRLSDWGGECLGFHYCDINQTINAKKFFIALDWLVLRLYDVNILA